MDRYYLTGRQIRALEKRHAAGKRPTKRQLLALEKCKKANEDGLKLTRENLKPEVTELNRDDPQFVAMLVEIEAQYSAAAYEIAVYGEIEP